MGNYRIIKKENKMKQRKLIQVKYPPFNTTVKTYADIYKYEDEMTEKDYENLRAEISKNQQ
tara:strand:+ start:193 stop:375 length:183 start_codon:yes stop_codon:yes gene_type:complete